MEEQRKVEKKKTYKIWIIIGCILVIAMLIGVTYFFSPVTQFKRSLESKNIAELKELYPTIQDYDERKKVESIFKDKMNAIVEQFVKGKISEQEAIQELERYQEVEILGNYIEEAKNNIKEVKTSKDSFSLAQQYEKEGKMLEAATEYVKVIEKDKENYKIAQNYIKTNKNSLKETVLSEVETSISQNDFITANQKLETLKTILKDDTQIETKIKEIKEKAEQQTIENYRKEQLLSVESATITIQDENYKSLYPDMMTIIVKNNSEKTVKSYDVSILGYDANGYPMKVKGKYDSTGVYEFEGTAEDANIVAGGVYGKDKGWNLYRTHGLSNIIAIVKNVTFYDGTTWDNPYYEYWIKEHKEKPLQ